ncbi:MAG: symmetrical bis(5'-nucleosyl)-tetraphosphatase [Kangiellaceae bacterium]
MATYAIGDIQGCYQSFIKLLKKINFNPNCDRLWLAGDMINRGSDSLKVIAYILENQSSISCVLGNHDLHFLAVAYGCKRINPKDTFADILNSDLRNDAMSYFKNLPLAITNNDHSWLMVHAGIHPRWSLNLALKLSQEVQGVLGSGNAIEYFENMYGNTPSSWSNDLVGHDRLRAITNIFTRMRYLKSDRSLELTEKNNPDKTPSHLKPWFEFNNASLHSNLLFGHWASLNGHCSRQNYYALDTGCVWGGKLTALRLEDKKRFQI